MTDHDDVAQRSYHEPDPDRIHVREEDGDDGLFRLRMPISSTLEARDGKAFERSRLDGWVTQINEGTVPVYGDHGLNADIAGSRYSAFGKLGYYDNAEVREIDGEDGEHELVADTVMMDPDTLSEDTGALRENMARLKAQIDRDMPIMQSVGWNDDTGNRDVPGGSDLLEGSIVGNASDTHASSHNAAVEMARAVSAANPDADPEQLVEDFRDVVMGSDARNGDDTETDMTHDIDDLAERSAFDVETLRGWDEGDLDALADTLDGRDADDGDNDSGESADARAGDKDDDYGERLDRLEEMNEEELRFLREEFDGDDDDDDDEDGENSADTDDTDERSVTVDGEEMSAEDALEKLRDGTDVDPEESETETRADDDDDDDAETRDDENDSDPTFSFN